MKKLEKRPTETKVLTAHLKKTCQSGSSLGPQGQTSELGRVVIAERAVFMDLDFSHE